MYAPIAAGARWERLDRARAKITRIRPMVATTSDTQCGPEARCLVEIDTAASENITLARIAPPMHPIAWTGGRPPLPPRESAEGRIDEGHHRVKWAPEIGPNIKMMAKSPAAVAAAFSKSWSPRCRATRSGLRSLNR